MARRTWQRGKFSDRREPIWEPLLELLPEDIEDFMWMGEVVLTDGTRIQLYKHYWNRRYICVDLGGRVFTRPGTDRWEEAKDADWILEMVVGFGRSRGDVVRRNEWREVGEIRCARSAAKHRVSRERLLHVIRHAGICWRDSESPEESYGDSRFLFLGSDEEGVALEVIAVTADDGSLMIIHAMPLRQWWHGWHQEAARWRR